MRRTVVGNLDLALCRRGAAARHRVHNSGGERLFSGSATRQGSTRTFANCSRADLRAAPNLMDILIAPASDMSA